MQGGRLSLLAGARIHRPKLIEKATSGIKQT